MNQLPLEKKAKIIQLLCEGVSLRATSRIVGCSINTVTGVLENVGYACQAFHNDKVKGLKTKRVQGDEIWAFVGCKQKNVKEYSPDAHGDVWTFTTMDADSKLIITWVVGDRTKENAIEIMTDLSERVADRIQLSTDSFTAYKNAVNEAFGRPNIDYGQVHKIYQSSQTETRYSPAVCIACEIRKISGNPVTHHISTSYIERQNLTMRMQMRRFTRLTNAFSKKIDNHCHAVALYVVYYNFVRTHSTVGQTPAMESGLTNTAMTFEDIVKLADRYKKNLN